MSDEIETLRQQANQLRAQLHQVEDRLHRLENEQWTELWKERQAYIASTNEPQSLARWMETR